MLKEIETYLGLHRATASATSSAEYLLKSFRRLCRYARAIACSHANGHRLGSARTVRRAT